MASQSRQKRRGSIIVYEDEKSEPTKGFNVNIFKNKENALQYQCAICKQICHNPVELSCADDYDYDSTDSNDYKSNNHDVLYCETCLSFNLSTNNNQCPINPKHLKTNYNIARNIRKQINNLSVYCSNNRASHVEGDKKGCKWEGTLHQLHTHLKACKYNTKVHCDICNEICTESTVNEHNAYNMVKHITLLHKQSSQKQLKKDKIEVNNNPVQVNEDFATKVEEQMETITTENSKLKKEIKKMGNEFNEWKIAYNIESGKTDCKLKKLINKQNDSITLLQQHSESQNKSIEQLKKYMKSNVSVNSAKQSKTKKSKNDFVALLQQENEKLQQRCESHDKSIQQLQSQMEQLKKYMKSNASINNAKQAKPKKTKNDSVILLQEQVKCQNKSIEKLESQLEHLKKYVKSNLSISIAKQSKKKKSKVTVLKSKDDPIKPDGVPSLKLTKKSLKRAKSKSVDTAPANLSFIKNSSKKKKRKQSAGSMKSAGGDTPDTDTPDTDSDFDAPDQPKLRCAAKSVPYPKRKMPAVLKRTASMRYFHPEAPEWYHSQQLVYEMYHPKKSVECWVTKNMGQMAKIMRYPCCGCAVEGNLYLMPVDSDKDWDEELFIVAQEDNMPDNWTDEMHLGCKENRKKNKQNKSYYECCKKGIRSTGCKQRYKCCLAEYNVKDKDGGCKVGWGC